MTEAAREYLLEIKKEKKKSAIKKCIITIIFIIGILFALIAYYTYPIIMLNTYIESITVDGITYSSDDIRNYLIVSKTDTITIYLEDGTAITTKHYNIVYNFN